MDDMRAGGMNEVSPAVAGAVGEWLAWVPSWRPPTHRGRARVCRRCAGSPVLAAAGLSRAVPHQVAHALNTRMQRIVDRAVDRYTAASLPLLSAELADEALLRVGQFSPHSDLPPELDGLDLDPEPEGDQPYLFTLAELAVEAGAVEPAERPPLTPEQKTQLIREIELADLCADGVGREVCFALVPFQPAIEQAVAKFIEPQIQSLLDQLSKQLDAPREL